MEKLLYQFYKRKSEFQKIKLFDQYKKKKAEKLHGKHPKLIISESGDLFLNHNSPILSYSFSSSSSFFCFVFLISLYVFLCLSFLTYGKY